MSKTKKSYRVGKIEEGTVLDHVPTSDVFGVLRILGIDKSYMNEGIITIGIGYNSKKLGKKGFIKIEGWYPSEEELNRLALLSPHITVNRIKEGSVEDKFSVQVPDTIESLVQCSHPNCISNASGEHVEPRLLTIQRKPPKLQCYYCGEYTKPPFNFL